MQGIVRGLEVGALSRAARERFMSDIFIFVDLFGSRAVRGRRRGPPR